MKFMTKIVPKTESETDTHTSKLGKTGLHGKQKTRRGVEG